TGSTVASYPSLYTAGAGVVVESTKTVNVASSGTKLIEKIRSDGTQSSFSDGVSGAQTLAVDGANNIWSGRNIVSEHTSSGANLTGAGFRLPTGTVTLSM